MAKRRTDHHPKDPQPAAQPPQDALDGLPNFSLDDPVHAAPPAASAPDMLDAELAEPVEADLVADVFEAELVEPAAEPDVIEMELAEVEPAEVLPVESDSEVLEVELFEDDDGPIEAELAEPSAAQPSSHVFEAELVEDTEAQPAPPAQTGKPAQPASDVFAAEFLEEAGPGATSDVLAAEVVDDDEEPVAAEPASAVFELEPASEAAEAEPASAVFAAEAADDEAEEPIAAEPASAVAEAQPASAVFDADDDAAELVAAEPASAVAAAEPASAVAEAESASAVLDADDEAEEPVAAQPASAVAAAEPASAVFAVEAAEDEEVELVAAEPTSAVAAAEPASAVFAAEAAEEDEVELVAAEPASAVTETEPASAGLATDDEAEEPASAVAAAEPASAVFAAEAAEEEDDELVATEPASAVLAAEAAEEEESELVAAEPASAVAEAEPASAVFDADDEAEEPVAAQPASAVAAAEPASAVFAAEAAEEEDDELVATEPASAVLAAEAAEEEESELVAAEPASAVAEAEPASAVFAADDEFEEPVAAQPASAAAVAEPASAVFAAEATEEEEVELVAAEPASAVAEAEPASAVFAADDEAGQPAAQPASAVAAAEPASAVFAAEPGSAVFAADDEAEEPVAAQPASAVAEPASAVFAAEAAEEEEEEVELVAAEPASAVAAADPASAVFAAEAAEEEDELVAAEPASAVAEAEPASAVFDTDDEAEEPVAAEAASAIVAAEPASAVFAAEEDDDLVAAEPISAVAAEPASAIFAAEPASAVALAEEVEERSASRKPAAKKASAKPKAAKKAKDKAKKAKAEEVEWDDSPAEELATGESAWESEEKEDLPRPRRIDDDDLSDETLAFEATDKKKPQERTEAIEELPWDEPVAEFEDEETIAEAEEEIADAEPEEIAEAVEEFEDEETIAEAEEEITEAAEGEETIAEEEDARPTRKRGKQPVAEEEDDEIIAAAEEDEAVTEFETDADDDEVITAAEDEEDNAVTEFEHDVEDADEEDARPTRNRSKFVAAEDDGFADDEPPSKKKPRFTRTAAVAFETDDEDDEDAIPVAVGKRGKRPADSYSEPDEDDGAPVAVLTRKKPKYGRRWLGGMFLGWLLMAGAGAGVWYAAPHLLKDAYAQIPRSPNDRDDNPDKIKEARDEMNQGNYKAALAKLVDQDNKSPLVLSMRGESRWLNYLQENKGKELDADNDSVKQAKTELKEAKNDVLLTQMEKTLEAAGRPKDDGGRLQKLAKDLRDILADTKTVAPKADVKEVAAATLDAVKHQQDMLKKYNGVAEALADRGLIADKDKLDVAEFDQKLKNLVKNQKELDSLNERLKKAMLKEGDNGVETLIADWKDVNAKLKAVDDLLAGKTKKDGAPGVQELLDDRVALEKKRGDLEADIKTAVKFLADSKVPVGEGDDRAKLFDGLKAIRIKAENPLAPPLGYLASSLSSVGTGTANLLDLALDSTASLGELWYYRVREPLIDNPQQKLDMMLSLLQDRKQKGGSLLHSAQREADWLLTDAAKSGLDLQAKANYLKALAYRNAEKYEEAKQSLSLAVADAEKVVKFADPKKTFAPWLASMSKSQKELTDPTDYYLPRIGKIQAAAKYNTDYWPLADKELDTALGFMPKDARLLARRAMVHFERTKSQAGSLKKKEREALWKKESDFIRADADPVAGDPKAGGEANYVLGMLEEELGNYVLAEERYNRARKVVEAAGGPAEELDRIRIALGRLLQRERPTSSESRLHSPDFRSLEERVNFTPQSAVSSPLPRYSGGEGSGVRGREVASVQKPQYIARDAGSPPSPLTPLPRETAEKLSEEGERRLPSPPVLRGRGAGVRGERPHPCKCFTPPHGMRVLPLTPNPSPPEYRGRGELAPPLTAVFQQSPRSTGGEGSRHRMPSKSGSCFSTCAKDFGSLEGSPKSETVYVHPLSLLVAAATVAQAPGAIEDDDDPEVKLKLKKSLDIAEELIKSDNPKTKGEGQLLKAKVWAREGKRTEALKLYVDGLKNIYPGIETDDLRKMMEQHPIFQQPDATTRPNPFLADYQYSLGRQAYWDRNYAKAEKHFKQAVTYNDKDARYFYFLGLAQLNQRTRLKRDAADLSFTRGGKLEADNNANYTNVSVALERIQGPLRDYIERYRLGGVNPAND